MLLDDFKMPSNWSVIQVDDAVNSISTSGKKIPQKQYSEKGELPVIDQGQEYIGGFTNDISLKIECSLPIIIFGDHTRVVKYVNQGFAAGADGVKVLESRGFFNVKLLTYFIQYISSKLPSHGYARHYQHLAKENLPLPPLNEQHRIVAKIEALFSELDNGMANLKAAQQQLKTYRQALLKHAFEGKFTAEWRAQNADKLESAETLLARIAQARTQRYQEQLSAWQANKTNTAKPASKPKAPKPLAPLTPEELAELPELPEGWGWARVGDVCDVVRGGSPRPAGDARFYGGNIPFLKVADITRDTSIYLKTFNYTITEAGLAKTRKITPNTLLLSNSGATLGVPKICMIDATMNDGVAAFLGLEQDELLFHYYFWQSKTDQLRNIDQGAAQPNLNTDLIKETCIPVCSKFERIKLEETLVNQFSQIDQLEQTITTALQQADALRQSILKKAFSGQLVPQDPNDEPASALLARIKSERAIKR